LKEERGKKKVTRKTKDKKGSYHATREHEAAQPPAHKSKRRNWPSWENIMSATVYIQCMDKMQDWFVTSHWPNKTGSFNANQKVVKGQRR
jgi:hypothetical protein